MDFFISFFMSPVALVLYGVLGVVLINPLIEKDSEYSRFKSFKDDLLATLQIAIVVSVIALITCQVHAPSRYQDINTHILNHFGMYIFGLFLLLCLWGFKRADKVKDDLFENYTDGGELKKGLSPKFKKFAFSVLFAVSLVGFVVSVTYEQWYEQQQAMRKEYNSKLSVAENRMKEELYYSDRLTREKHKEFSDLLSAYNEKYEKAIKIPLWDEIKLRKKCENMLADIEKKAEQNEEINEEFQSELQRFLSVLPDTLNEEQWDEYRAILLNIRETYRTTLSNNANNSEFFASAETLFVQCQQELESRGQLNK